jgi:zinc protease
VFDTEYVMMRAGLVVLVVGACTIELGSRPRPPAPPSHAETMGLTLSSTVLGNGLRVVTVIDPAATEVQVTARYGVGAIDDDAHPGMAHLVEHLMFEQQIGGQSVFMQLEDTATYFNATTTLDATTYVARAPASGLGTLIAIEALRLQERCATMDDSAFAREREVVINELAQRDQASEVMLALHTAVFPEGHPYRRGVGGSAATVGAITRAQACAFADAYYAPGNVAMVVSGPLSKAQLDTTLATLGSRITQRAGVTPHRGEQPMPRPQHLEVDAPIDQDVLVLAWPLPADPELRIKVRAIGSALTRLVSNEITGDVMPIELGDRAAPMLGLAVLPDESQTLRQTIDAARRGVAGLSNVFREAADNQFDGLMFERIKQGAIYSVYSGLEDGSTRDERLATYALAGAAPDAALAKEIRALQELTRDEAVEIAGRYFATNTPSVVTLKASSGRKRGDTLSLRAPVHDFGRRRTQVDPALANRPAVPSESRGLDGMQTRVLPNGLKVVLLPISTVPTVDARLIFGAGTVDEPWGLRGVALLAANTLTWNLRHLSDLVEFARAGALRDVDVTTDSTTFTVKGIDSHLDVILAGLRRWVCDGTYDDSAAEFVNTMRRAAKRVDDQAALTDVWRSSLFGAGHPYVEAGVVRHVNNMLTLEHAAGFRDAYYRPDNATLLIAGRFDPALANEWVDYLFKAWPGRASARYAVRTQTKPASIAKVDDTALVQLRVAIPATNVGRAQELVAAAMLADIAHDVRFRLGASYSFEGALAETRLAKFFVLTGWVDAARAADAMQLIRDRIAELRTDATAAARAFVIARGHVVTQLRSRVGSAGALAGRIERDVELARGPLSDLATARTVEGLTIADMTSTFAELDLAHATVLMDGPSEDMTKAFSVLGRTPYVVQPPPAAPPGWVPPPPPPFWGAEQRVARSELEPALTEQPQSRLMWRLSLGAGLVGVTGLDGILTGYSASAGLAYRYGWHDAIGVHVETGKYGATDTDGNGLPRTITAWPVDLLAVWHFGGPKRSFGELMGGVHMQQLSTMSQGWQSSPMYSLQGGVDLVVHRGRRLGLAVSWSSTTDSNLEYDALGLALYYRE